MFKLLGSSLLLLSILSCAFGGVSRGTVSDLPKINSEDVVYIYFLESSFPYNAPKEALDFAGLSFVQFATLHAGIGVWDVTTDMKITIEFVAHDYKSSIFPLLLSDGYLKWNNSGSVVVTSPLSDDNWVNSRHVITTTGVPYLSLVNYLQDTANNFRAYQPITITYSPLGNLQNISDYVNVNPDGPYGGTVISSFDSYFFANDVLLNLGRFGCHLDSFLQIYASSLVYLSNGTSYATVSWDINGPANPDVYSWYENLLTCYKTQKQENGDNGADQFIELLSQCYHDYAYIYASPNSVYNISLHKNYNVSTKTSSVNSVVSTPFNKRYIYSLPSSTTPVADKLGVIDIILIAGTFITVFWAIFSLFSNLFRTNKRRRISISGDKVAEDAVSSLKDSDGRFDSYFEHRSSFGDFESSKKKPWAKEMLKKLGNFPEMIKSAKNKGNQEKGNQNEYNDVQMTNKNNNGSDLMSRVRLSNESEDQADSNKSNQIDTSSVSNPILQSASVASASQEVPNVGRDSKDMGGKDY